MEQIVGFEYNSKTIRVSKLSKSKSGLSLSKCKLKKTHIYSAKMNVN